MSSISRLALVLGILAAPAALSQQPSVPQIQQGPGDGTMLLTVFLKHDQAKNLNEINEQLRKNGYYEQFPPAGVDVLSWYVVMGIGQIVTLKFPAEKLRAVNVALENTAWGPYRTEFFPAYDYKEIASKQAETMRSKGRQ